MDFSIRPLYRLKFTHSMVKIYPRKFIFLSTSFSYCSIYQRYIEEMAYYLKIISERIICSCPHAVFDNMFFFVQVCEYFFNGWKKDSQFLGYFTGFSARMIFNIVINGSFSRSQFGNISRLRQFGHQLCADIV